MDLDRIVHPLRLARGSHQPGSGKGCAMNAISYIEGDEQITDFPATSARPLASFVQLCNDLLAGPDGYLSPEDSLTVLDLGWLTVGTAEVADTVIHTWVTKLLVSPPGESSDTPRARRRRQSPLSPNYIAGSHPVIRRQSPPGTAPPAPRERSAARCPCVRSGTPSGPHTSRPHSLRPMTGTRSMPLPATPCAPTDWQMRIPEPTASWRSRATPSARGVV